MADNVITPVAASTSFATDDIAGVHYPKQKMTFGPNDTATNVTKSTPFPVSQAGSYEAVAASATNQVLGATGAVGDILAGVLLVPATLSPGAVSIKDGGGTAITVFVGGASSLTTLHPFFVPIGAVSASGAWQITTGANISAIGVGTFT